MRRSWKEAGPVKKFSFGLRQVGCKVGGFRESVETARVEVSSLEEQVARADTEMEDSAKLVAKVREKSEQRMVRLNVAIVGRNSAEKLTRPLLTELDNDVDAVVQQLGYDAVIRLPQGL